MISRRPPGSMAVGRFLVGFLLIWGVM